MTIKNIKIVAVSTMLFFCISHTQASMLQNLADVANGALPTYGRTDAPGQRTDLSDKEINEALRELLTIASHNVADKLTRYGYSNSSVRIDLPKNWRKARKIADRIGYRSEFDKLERSLAEIAVEIAPKTRDLLTEMIASINIVNPGSILNGHDVSATFELRSHVADRLSKRLQPVVNELLTSSGVFTASNEIVRQVKHLSVLNMVETDFTNHLVDESLDGYFHYLAQEERAIRLHPLDQQSDVLRRVFG